ncbi:hypothetical protein Ddye_005112 [Dipteronia dyeriana]|uniref:Uncharacterized protein n=1 Tax=Dipteronia dyeriana TaxID=168575 RepID=A0AAD9XFN0_9ROSI|nr:hypothetical protein Ddye_005112 [Dipteronia dyeriana]
MNATATLTLSHLNFPAKCSCSFLCKPNLALNLISSNTKPNQCLQKWSSLPLGVSSSETAHLVVEDDLNAFLQILPCDLRDSLLNDSKRGQLLEVILDLGRLPEARYQGEFGGKYQ